MFSHVAPRWFTTQTGGLIHAADRRIGKAQDYEVLAASHSERGALVGGGEHLAAAAAFTVAAIILHEVAAALDGEWAAE